MSLKNLQRDKYFTTSTTYNAPCPVKIILKKMADKCGGLHVVFLDTPATFTGNVTPCFSNTRTHFSQMQTTNVDLSLTLT